MALRTSRRGLSLAACGVLLVAVAATTAGPDQAVAGSSCASLGAARDFAVFSNSDFVATASAGTSITGRIAADRDVNVDGVFIGPAAGDAPPTVIAGRDFTAGRATGNGGTLNGGVRYRRNIEVAPNFAVSGARTQGDPPFVFQHEFNALGELSAVWADLPRTPRATTTLNPSSRGLELVGRDRGLNVFVVDAADLTAAAGITLNLIEPGASALINVTTVAPLSIAPQYMNLSGSAAAGRIAWNLSQATQFNVLRGVAWKGLILAPKAVVTSAGRPQLEGQLIAKSVPDSDWVISKRTFAGCLPGLPDETLGLEPLCVDSLGRLVMRLRNTGTSDRDVDWVDLTGRDFGSFVARAGRDAFFYDRGGDESSVVRATSGTAQVAARGTSERCEGRITVRKVRQGPAPADRAWTIRVAGDGGRYAEDVVLRDGESRTLAVPGGYQEGSAPIGGVVGGNPYVVAEPDPLGARATISVNPIVILDGQNEAVTVTNTYPEVEPPDPGPGPGPAPQPGPDPGPGPGPAPQPGPDPGPGPGPAPQPEPDPGPDPGQPTLPPGVPEPLPGPDIDAAEPGEPAADLEVTHSIVPGTVAVGEPVRTVERVRNRGAVAAQNVVLRELPQNTAAYLRTVSTILRVHTQAGVCRGVERPGRCELGTIPPGGEVIVTTRTRMHAPGAYRSVVIASSTTPETNTTNNTGVAGVRVDNAPALGVGVAAPPTGSVGRELSYVVSARIGGARTARSVRVCTRPPETLTEVRAPGTVRRAGAACREYRLLRRGRVVSFRVYGVPAASGRLTVPASATSVDVDGTVRAADRVLVLGGVVCRRFVSRC
jgi:choice-of-anchor A domain-containing protein